MTDPSHIQRLLKAGDNPLLAPITDQDDRKFYANGFDGLLKQLAQAAVADGFSRRNIMRLFMNHAYEVMTGELDNRQSAQAVLNEALSLHSMFDDPKMAS